MSNPAARRAGSGTAREMVTAAMQDRVYIAAIAAAVAVSAGIMYTASDRYDEVHAWSRVPGWMASPMTLGAVLLVSLVLAGLATAAAYRADANSCNVVVPLILAGICASLLLSTYLTYRVHNFGAAFFVSAVSLLLLAALVFAISRAATPMAVAALVPLAVVLVSHSYVVWFMADEASDSISATPTVA